MLRFDGLRQTPATSCEVSVSGRDKYCKTLENMSICVYTYMHTDIHVRIYVCKYIYIYIFIDAASIHCVREL